MHTVRKEPDPGKLDLRQFGPDLCACEDAALVGRVEEARDLLFSVLGRTLSKSNWAWKVHEKESTVPLAGIHRIEARREALVFFLDGVPEGTSAIIFDLVTSAPCDVTLPPAWASPMYRPEVFGRAVSLPIIAGASMLKADPIQANGMSPWEDESWVRSMLDFASKNIEPSRARIIAKKLRRGRNLRSILIDELANIGTKEAGELLFLGFPYRSLRDPDRDGSTQLRHEIGRRREILGEYLCAAEKCGSNAAITVLLERILGDVSLVSILAEMRDQAQTTISPSTLLVATRADRENRLRVAPLLSREGKNGKVPALITFMGASRVLLRAKSPKEHGREAIKWVLRCPHLQSSIEPKDLEDLVHLLRNEMGILVEIDTLVPTGLLDIPITNGKKAKSFSTFLAGALQEVELGYELSGTGDGISIVPLGTRVGLDEKTIRRRLISLLEERGRSKRDRAPEVDGH
jgi:hypothetical protein